MSADALYWPAGRATEGLELLARAARLPLRALKPAAVESGTEAGQSLPRAAASLGLDVEPIDASVQEVDGLLRSAGPAVIRVAADRFVMLVGRRGRKVKIVRPDHRVVSVAVADVRDAMVEAERSPLIAETERLVDEIGLAARRRQRVVSTLLGERLRSRKIEAGWLVRVPAGSSFGAQLIAAGARRKGILLVLAHAAQYVLAIVAWWLLGRAALLGHLDEGWLSAWVLALLTLVPIQLFALYLQGRLAIDAGALLKQRLLAGAFRLEPEEIRREGAGQLLGRVIEAEAVESLALGGGLAAGLAALELLLAAVVLALAAPWLAVLLVLWSVACGVLGWVYYGRRGRWATQRIELTHDLIESMLGHRTRIAQQTREHWHDGEDEAVERYVQASALMDRSAVWLLGLVPRGWVILALIGLSPLFVNSQSPVTLAVALGGMLLGFKAFDRLTNGMWNLAGAAIAWRQTSPVFRAATRTSLGGDSPPVAAPAGAASSVPILDATDLRFTHAGRAEPVLRGCTLSIGRGERLILQGESGGGKSTLASLLSGLRTPQSGLLLLDGVDRHTVGPSGWRRRVVLVPQFHENHVMLSTVAFNVLMGGSWPPAVDDFDRAETILRDLGLGGTLDRMPSGILQTVGETGWQLSHGERSRLFLARALLQNPDVLILDESFAQLDPDTMRLALDAVVARAPAVVLIAHP
jgi:ATP-binding cassette subfamily B protein